MNVIVSRSDWKSL